MAIADTARLLASLELQDKFTPGIKKANRALGQFDAKLDKTGTRAYRAGQQIGTGLRNVGKLAVVGVGIVAANVALGVNSLIELEQQIAQTNAVIKSTKGVAGITGAEVGRLAEKFEALNATVGDEFIRGGANMLLTFTNIRKKAFEPALQAVLDMNTALGKGPEGLTSTAIQVGKALNNPTKGLTALQRAGVTFTAKQAKKIKSLQAEGKLYEAQQIILKELNKEFGGSFLGQGNTTAGKVAKFTDSIEDLQRALAKALLPAIGNIADELTTFLQDPEVIRGTEALGKQIGDLFSKENIRTGIALLKDAFNTAREIAPIVASAAKITAGALKIAVDAFNALPPDIQKLAIAGLAVNKLTGGLVTNIAGGLIGAVLRNLSSAVVGIKAGVVHVSGPVTGPGGVPGAPGGAPGKPGGPPARPGVPSGRGAVASGGAGAFITREMLERANAKVEAAINRTTAAVKTLDRDLDNPVTHPKTPPRQEGALHGLTPAQITDAVAAAIARRKTTLDVQNPDRNQGAVKAALITKEEVAKWGRISDGNFSALGGDINAIATETISNLQKQQGAITALQSSGSRDAQATRSRIEAARIATTQGASNVRSQVAASGSAIQATIRATRPIVTTIVKVNVSASGVSKSVTEQTRYGPGNGSAGGGRTGRIGGP